MIVKHFTKATKFAKSFKPKEIDAAIKYFANPSADAMKALTKSEVKIVETMLKNSKYWTKTMLKAAGQQEEVAKVLKQIKDLKNI